VNFTLRVLAYVPCVPSLKVSWFEYVCVRLYVCPVCLLMQFVKFCKGWYGYDIGGCPYLHTSDSLQSTVPACWLCKPVMFEQNRTIQYRVLTSDVVIDFIKKSETYVKVIYVLN
jgi:hypothetical protein